MASSLNLSHTQAADLLGAYVLDACDAIESAAVEAHLAECPICTAEVTAFREVVDVLADVEAVLPPSHLEAAILQQAASTHQPAISAYREVTDALDRLLSVIADDEWDRPAWESWSCRDMVAHLAAIDSLLVTTLGHEPLTPETDADFLARTLAAIERNRRRPPAETAAEWRAVSDRLNTYRGGLDEQLNWFGLPLPARGVLVTRAFETWLHTDDIRLATGRPRQAPSPETLAAMSDVAVHLLPTALAALGHTEGHAPAVARVVLSGAGGGTWDLLLGDADLGNPPDVVLQADTIGFCRMAGGRLDPAELGPVIEGDEALGHALVEAGAALAMP